MSIKKKSSEKTKKYDVRESLKRAKSGSTGWKISVMGRSYRWSTKMDRIKVSREGLPYEAIEIISRRVDLPVKRILQLFGVPQTTYNKRKRESHVLNITESEIVLVLIELLDYGTEVFNNENEKFQRWLKKPNVSLGGATPVSLFDSLTGIQEVRNSLNRLEYGNLA